MRKFNFNHAIAWEYFPDHKIVKAYYCHVFYEADSLDNIKLTGVTFDPYMPMMNNILYCRLITEIEEAAKNDYDTRPIEHQEYNDSEIQEQKFL